MISFVLFDEIGLIYLDIMIEKIADGSERSGYVVGAEGDPNGLEISGRDGHFGPAVLVEMGF